jgi:hypothetical protein
MPSVGQPSSTSRVFGPAEYAPRPRRRHRRARGPRRLQPLRGRGCFPSRSSEAARPRLVMAESPTRGGLHSERRGTALRGRLPPRRPRPTPSSRTPCPGDGGRCREPNRRSWPRQGTRAGSSRHCRSPRRSRPACGGHFPGLRPPNLRAQSKVDSGYGCRVVPQLRLDYSVIAVSSWEVSNRFFRDVLGADLIAHGEGGRMRTGSAIRI